MGKTRVLLIINRWNPNGGVEKFLEQLVSETSCSIDYSICSLITPVESCVSCNKIGPVLISGRLTDMFFRRREIETVMQNGGYDVVHIQASNGTAFYLANLARKVGVPHRIVHSHNSGGEGNKNLGKFFVGKLASLLYATAPTKLWACSANAGEYLFGRRDFQVFYNGIDLDEFAFSIDKRLRIRKSLGVNDDQFLLGSIGRISLQKNPVFQLRVYSELRRRIPHARFCMIGQGDLEKERDKEIERLELGDSVITIPCTTETDAFYCAFDALLLPSVFEGLSFVGIESQCCGLPIYCSTAVPDELDVTDRITYLSLDDAPRTWAAIIERDSKTYRVSERFAYSKIMRDEGFDKTSCFSKIAQQY